MSKLESLSVLRKTAIMLIPMIAVIMPIMGQLKADELRVAVASNFSGAIKEISNRFEAKTGHKVTLIFGSTGKHYAQIKNGAPFELFFSADIHRAALLEKEGLAIPGSRFTYAVGKVVLWSPKEKYVDPGGKVLEQMEFLHLAIANPKLAPYGKAAQEVLQARGVWGKLDGKLVRGENINQTFQFVKSSNAELGFVALSQIKRHGHPIEGSRWEVPQALYTPIEQQAVQLKESEAGRSFLSFVRAGEALNIIKRYGYGIP